MPGKQAQVEWKEDSTMVSKYGKVFNFNVLSFEAVVINKKFAQFAKDVGFVVNTCRPYRPQTKGKVECVAKLMDRLKVI